MKSKVIDRNPVFLPTAFPETGFLPDKIDEGKLLNKLKFLKNHIKYVILPFFNDTGTGEITVKVGVNYGGGCDRGKFADIGNLLVLGGETASDWEKRPEGSKSRGKSRAVNI
ncbi:MAG: hypothetical protein Fur0025_31580 [Oscillatoriaceae cyanobacterium]